MQRITHADLLANMDDVRRAIVTRYAWLIHVTPVEAVPNISKDGLTPESDALPPDSVLKAIGSGRMVFFSPLGVSQAAPPVSHKHEGANLSGNFATLAIRSSCIVGRVDIDWSFKPADVQGLIDSTLQGTIDGVVADLVRRLGSFVTYDIVTPEKLRVFRTGDPPSNPDKWRSLSHEAGDYGVFRR